MQSTQSPGIELANHAPEINHVAIIVHILATSAVVARLISRKLQKIHLRATDYTIILSLFLGWGKATDTFIGNSNNSLWATLITNKCFLLAVSYGLGRHSKVLLSTDILKLRQVRAHSVNKDYG